MPTTDAPEYRLALAVLRCDMIASGAGLGAVARVDEYHGDPGGGGFVGESAFESAPAGPVDGSVQPGLGRGSVGQEDAGLVRVGSWVGAAHHVLGRQVLEHDQIVVPNQGGGGLFNPVVAPVANAGVRAADLGLGFGSPARSWLLAGEALVQSGEFGLEFRGGRDAQYLAVRRGDRGGHPPIYTHCGSALDADERRLGGGETHVPAPGPIERDPGHAVLGGQRPRQPKPYRPALGDEHRRPLPIQFHHGDVANTEPFIAPGFTPAGPAVGAAPPVLQRLIEIAEGLLLHRARTLTQPAVPAGLGELAHPRRPRGRAAARPPAVRLFQRQVPHEPRVATMPDEHRLGRGLGVEAVAVRHLRPPSSGSRHTGARPRAGRHRAPGADTSDTR